MAPPFKHAGAHSTRMAASRPPPSVVASVIASPALLAEHRAALNVSPVRPVLESPGSLGLTRLALVAPAFQGLGSS
jgi:hypothetical protein